MEHLEEFKDALSEFVREVCEALSQVNVPRRLWTRIVREKEGQVSFPQEERQEGATLPLGLLVALHTNPPGTLRRVIEVVRCDPELAATLLVDAGGKPIAEEKAQEWWATNLLAGAFLRAYFNRAMQRVFDQDVFNAVFSQFVTEINSPVVAVTELSPLINAHMDCERIDIAPGLSIRKLTIGELEEWLNQYMELPFMMMHGLSPADPSRLDCAIEVKYGKGRYEGWGARRDISERVSDLATALRLLTDKNIHIAFTRHSADSILQPGGGTSSSIRAHLPWPNAQLTFSLQPELVGIWCRIQALPSDSTVRLALRRWNIVSERFSEEDALIDYWISFESLFAPDSFQEVRYRASLRIAAFVGASPEEREQIYSELKASYDLRSRIVHGGVPNPERTTGLIGKTRSYLRTALLKLLHSDEPFKPQVIESNLLRK